MGQYNRSTRHQKMYVNDNENKNVYPKNCVPTESKRPKGSWTKGVMAWEKGAAGSPDVWVGWFSPPRLRKGRHTHNYGSIFNNSRTQEEE